MAGDGASRRPLLLALLLLATLPLIWVATISHSPTRASAASSCPLDPVKPLVQVGMTLNGCEFVTSATSSVADPLPFWGAINCETSSRVRYLTEGGDPSLTATGETQAGGGAFRRPTVFDGDDVAGERCELGGDERGRNTFYEEGHHRVTYMSLRLPSSFPLDAGTWQVVMEMMQSKPSHPIGGSQPVLSLDAYGNRWRVESPEGEQWSFPAQPSKWTRFAWDVYYSKDPAKGWLQVSVDLNDDGDFADPGERSPVIHLPTLKAEAAGSFNGEDGLAPGDPIPSNLKIGTNHAESIACPEGCSLDFDNIQILDAGPATEAPAPQRTLTVSLSGAGDGTVDGPGIACPGDCTQTYPEGSVVTLTASPEAGSTLRGWSGDCAGTASTCRLEMNGDRDATATFDPPSACPLASSAPTTPLGMAVQGCDLIASDTAAESNPLNFWGDPLYCASSSRYSYLSSEGDTHLTATGNAQGNSAYRRLTVLDGDDVWGERCELGLNDYRYGPTAFYHQGQRRATYISLRLPSNYPLANSAWQTVMQMKQAQPSDAGGGGPILEMQAREGRWIVINAWHDLWSFPAQAGKWTRFAWDVYYNQDPTKGWLQVSADLNGDGDFNDSGERSPILHAATLKTETEGPNGTSDGLAPGDPIPSHLRAGIYHSSSASCPAPGGCSVNLDNVQVVGP